MSNQTDSPPLFQKVDCIRLSVSDLEVGLQFYRDRLGHSLIWRTQTDAGLRLPDSDAEIVLHTEPAEPEIDLLVASADQAATRFKAAGGAGPGTALRHPDRPRRPGPGPVGQPPAPAG